MYLTAFEQVDPKEPFAEAWSAGNSPLLRVIVEQFARSLDALPC